MSRRIIYFIAAFWFALAQTAPAQQLGGLARIDPATSAATDLGFSGVDIALSMSQGVPYRVYTLAEPMRLVVDFREVDWTGADPATMRQTARITELRFGGFRPGWSRLVAVLADPMKINEAGLSIDENDGTAHLNIRLSKVSSEAFAESAGAPRDARFDLPQASSVSQPRAASDRLLVMVDPGHGGIDPGAQNGDATEARLMLILARELQETLLRAGGFDVMLTRNADVFVSLEGRVALAHRAGADVFISLHADALNEGVARGATVYTLAEDASDAASEALAERHNRDDLLSGLDLTGSDDRVANVLLDLARLDNTPRGKALAEHLVVKIENAVGTVHKRPLRQASFSVLKAADIPSVLIEVGFLSTNADLKSLKDPIWRASMAAGIRDGLQAWALEDAALARLRRQ